MRFRETVNIDELVEGILSGERAITYKEACLLAQLKDKEPLYEGRTASPER